MKKKLLLLMFVLSTATNVFAVEVEIDGLWYEVISKTNEARIIQCKNNNSYSGDIEIPAEVTYNNVTYNVTAIGNGAFKRCNITSVEIPSSIKTIEYEAFCDNYSLVSVAISNLETWCNISFIGNPNPLFYAHHLYLNGEEVKELIIPDRVTNIKQYAFSGASYITSVKISNSVTTIEEGAFYKCFELTYVNIPSSVKSIGPGAFKECNNLKTVDIQSIEAWCNIQFLQSPYDASHSNYLLNYAHNLYLNGEEVKDLVIPNNITIINDYAFDGCSGLSSISIPNIVSSIGCYAFRNCTGLTSITIPNNATKIDGGAFDGCTGLTSIDLPNSITTLGGIVFRGCSSLTSLTLGSGLNSIGNNAFSGCKELTNVFCYAEKVPTTSESNIFEGSYIEYATLHVPINVINNYREVVPWKDFKEIVAISGETPEIPKCKKPTISYDNGKLIFTSETEDVDFVTDITDTDIKKYYDATITLTATYNISVYATKSGYDNSVVATATLCWIDQKPETEGIINDVSQVAGRAVLIQSIGGVLTIQGVDEGTKVSVYNVAGVQTGSAIGKNGQAMINTNLQTGNIAIVKIGDKAVKILIK